MKRLALIAALLLCLLPGLNAQKKQAVSVLYVGGSADIETAGVSEMPAPEVLEASAAARTASFQKLLKKYFKTVKVVDAKDYSWQMSNDYDVTIIDGKPEPISPRIYDMDEGGNLIRYELAQYFPLNFDRPVITIANFGEEMGRRIGTKNDWYCLCLEDMAHHWDASHPIFQGPVKVSFEVTDEPTPAPALEVAKMLGYTLPATTSMFKMQNVNYETDPNYRIGMVSRPGGYLDSPETEVISSGKCAKSIDAVALGRHANWFTWGFSASPDKMTDAAKALFVNAVVYMKQFAGQHPIAHKLNDGVATRDHIAQYSYSTSKEGYNDYVASIDETNRIVSHLKDSLNAVIAAGGQIDPVYAVYLQFPEQPKPAFRDFIRSRAGDLYPVFGEDASEYARYYEKNRDYFYCPQDSYSLVLDQDLRYLKMANDDISTLDKCISILEKGEKDLAEAEGILKRYTLCRFGTPSEWREWFETYKDKLFFTESGGYLWLVDTFEDVPGNDYNVLLDELDEQYAAKRASVAPQSIITDDKNPVYISASVVNEGRGGKDIVIFQKIHQGYHTYAVVPDDESFIPTSVEITLPEGWQTAGKFYTPSTRMLDASGTLVYEGSGEFRQAISGSGDGQATVKVHYQCCNSNGCLIPTTKTFTIDL